MRSLGVEFLEDGIDAGLLLQAVQAGWPGLVRSMAMPSLNHKTASLERLKMALGLAKGTPLPERMPTGRPRSRKICSNAVIARCSRVDSSASQSSRKREVWSVSVRG